MTQVSYYVYYDEEKTPFFLNPTTNQVTYDVPTDGPIFDPDTKERWYPPQASTQTNENPIIYYVYFDDQKRPYFVNSQGGQPSYDLPKDGKIIDPTTKEEWNPPKVEKIYYVYFNSDNKPYFVNKAGGDPTYEAPKDGKILDPKTSKEWDPNQTSSETKENEGKDTPEAKEEPKDDEGKGDDGSDKKDIADIQVSQAFELDFPDPIKTFQPPKASPKPSEPKSTPAPTSAADQDIDDQDVVKTIDSELASKIHEFQIEEYAKKFFREHRRAHTFSKKRIAIEALVSFTDEPLTEPLLQALDKNSAALAPKCFKWILTYTGVIPSKTPASSAQQIVTTLQTNPQLRDEVYFQLIKQTSHTPDNQLLTKGLELFLIIATIFPSTRNSENWIKAHLANLSKHPNIIAASLAQFTYIRFSARCASNRVLEDLEINYVKKIPQQVSMGWQTFGASIYEMMWNQRTKEPKLPIPFIEYYMATFLLKLGAANTEGIFRLPGNLKKVDEMAKGTNNGKDMISGAPLNDIASLFKKWFRDLPNPVVPIDRVPDVFNLYEDGTKDYIGFCNTLPRPHKMVLMYLVGFLQELVKSESKTLMTAKNYAIVFGPNIIQMNDVTEQSQSKKLSDIAIDFLQTLIETWDTSEIYPMKRKYLASPPPDMPE